MVLKFIEQLVCIPRTKLQMKLTIPCRQPNEPIVLGFNELLFLNDNRSVAIVLMLNGVFYVVNNAVARKQD